MEKNIAYDNVQFNENSPESTTDYEMLELPHASRSNEQILAKTKANGDTKKARYFHIFFFLFSAVILVLSLTCFTFVIVYYCINQPHEAQQDQAIKMLQTELNNSSKEFQFQLQNAQHVIQTLEHQFNNKIKGIVIPNNSCKYLPVESPSGYYHIETSVGIKRVFCDTSMRHCGCNASGGWTRVANIDMTNPNEQCPNDFHLQNRTEPPKRLCSRPDNHYEHCLSTIFSVFGIEYTRVCGRIVGYQVGSTEAFLGYNDRNETIDGYYITGYSLTNGQSPR